MTLPKILTNVGMLDDGVNRYHCSCCNDTIDIQGLAMSDYQNCGGGQLVIPFPVKYCWSCGVKFNRWIK